MEPQLPDELEVSEETQELVVVVVPPEARTQPRVFTLEKYVKNGAKYFTGTSELDKAEEWSLCLLKNLGRWKCLRIIRSNFLLACSRTKQLFGGKQLKNLPFLDVSLLLHGMNS